jgi:diguanylate cyclase (GGDEF)-like protein
MKGRRRDDRPLHVLRLSWPAEEQPGAFLVEPSASEADLLLLAEGPDALLVSGGSVARVARGEGDDELLSRAATHARTGADTRRIRGRAAVAGDLIAYGERLRGARAVGEVHEALADCAQSVVGGCAALVLQRDATGLRPAGAPGQPPARALPFLPRMAERQGTLTSAECTRGDELAYAPLLDALGARMLAFAACGDDRLLCLVERRGDRVLDEADWALLHALAGQAEDAAERIRLQARVSELEVRDPVTGLANRRQLEVAAPRVEAAAQRGDGLAVVMLGLEWPGVPFEPERDAVLRSVAASLQDTARASDLTVRYADDQFLVLLPGSWTTGAMVFLRRLRERLAGVVSLSAGIAEFAPAADTLDRVIATAAGKLEAVRRTRHLPSVPA